METIVECLKTRASSTPSDIAYTYIDDQGRASALSYSDLYQKAQSTAEFIVSKEGRGERVLLLVPQGPEYIAAFFGCLLAQAVAVPLYPPSSSKHAERVKLVEKDCTAKFALVTRGLYRSLSEKLSPLGVYYIDDCLERRLVGSLNKADKDNRGLAEKNAVAFLQYTSGSTGNPKGVMISHENIIANLNALKAATNCDRRDVFVNWLPLFHDLGLINTLLLPLYIGAHSVLMSPAHFLKRPLDWLQAISDFKGTISGAPNFAFEHCRSRVPSEHLAGIDLSHWRIAFNAAEPIAADTITSFTEKFAVAGFRETAFYPAYGMAEATVFISAGKPLDPLRMRAFNADDLQTGKATEAAPGQRKQMLVGCGRCYGSHDIKIVDLQSGAMLPENRIGEIWFSGPSVARGYWNDPEKTSESFYGTLDNGTSHYLRTGDLGFLCAGELFISGRIKDVLIIRGRNYYPQDIERICQQAYAGLSAGGGAAFEVEGRAILVQEVERRAIKTIDYARACDTIQTEILEQFDLVFDDIVFIKPGRLAKTSSGKVQRSRIKKHYLAGALEPLYSSLRQTADVSQVFAAPASPTEIQLCAIWKDELGLDGIGIDDKFFGLGGESLRATKIVARIKTHWRCNISVRDMFEQQTIRNLAQLLDKDKGSDSHLITAAPVNAVPVLSYMQQSLWLIDKIDRNSIHYNIAKSFSLTGDLNISALKSAFHKIVERHHVLRTVISQTDSGEPVPVLLQDFEMAIPVVNIAHLAEGDQVKEVERLSNTFAAEPFDLSRDLMIRVQLIQQAQHARMMLVVLHHIACDGWSEGILIKELNHYYTDQLSASADTLPSLECQYADYANWQRSWLQGDRLSRYLAFWKRELKGIPELHSLPLDSVRPLQQSFCGDTVSQSIDVNYKEQLKAVALNHNVTLFAVLHAAFVIWLARHSNEQDIVVGTPVANREQFEIAPLVGLFVNTIVLRTNIADNPSFEQLIQRCQRYLLKTYEYQLLPFEKLVDELKPERKLSYSPLFQIKIALQNNETGALDLPGIKAQEREYKSPVTKNDLSLDIYERENELYLEWEFATDLFQRSTIENFAVRFQELIHSLVKNPQGRVWDFPLLPPAERLQLQAINNTAKPYPSKKCIQTLFEYQVSQHPALAALISQSGSVLTYAELNDEANKLAHYLVEQGVVPETLIGLCIERSLELIIGILGILKAGGAYVPIDPDYPPGRIEYLLEDSGVEFVLTESHLLSDLPFGERKVFPLDGELRNALLKDYSTENIDPGTLGLNPSNLAYVIYTSGSTGQPKGVLLEHAGVCNLANWQKRYYNVLPGSKVSQFSSFNFDGSVGETFMALLNGATLVMLDRLSSPQDLIDAINSHDIGTAVLVPSLMNELDPRLLSAKASPINVVAVGEVLPLELAELWSEYCDFHNGYGPTECTVYSHIWAVPRNFQRADYPRVPIGKPIDNIRHYVLDKNLNPVPMGTVGELYLAGVGLARGYLNRRQLTSEKFIEHPRGLSFPDGHFRHDYSACTGESRIYKTGDLVRQRADGNLEFIGRTDQQVKIRGQRVELGEVESLLSSHAKVEQAAVLLQRETADQNLIAYIMPKVDVSNAEADRHLLFEELRAYANSALSEAMRPSAFVAVRQFPLTSSGKLDRAALALIKAEISPSDSVIAPKTETETKLCNLWSSLLRLQTISTAADFFALGGHSLLAVRLVAEIRQLFQVAIDVRTLFEHKTIRQLAAVIDSAERVCVATIEKSPEHLPLVLSYAQQRLWLVDQIEPGSAQYNIPMAFRLDGKLDIGALQKAFRAIVTRHQVLRTTISTSDNGEPLQVINSADNFAVALVDLQNHGVEEQSRAIEKHRNAQAVKAFDLSADLMLRVVLLKCGTLESPYYILLVTLHHIAADAWSGAVLIDEFASCYRAFSARQSPQLPEPPLQYTDYAQWQRSWLQEGAQDQLLDYWKNRLSGIPDVHNLPLDFPRPQEQCHAGKLFRQRLSEDLAVKLKDFALAHDATLFMVLYAAYSVLLARYSGEKDIVIGTPVANREQSELSSMVGFFVNSLVLRADFSQQPDFLTLLAQCKQDLIDAYAHQALPFEKLVDELQPERNLGYSPLFQVKLALQNNEVNQLELPGVGISALDSIATTAKHDLSLDVFEDETGLLLLWEYATDLFRADTVERLSTHFIVLLNAIVEQPKTCVFELPLLTDAEQHFFLRPFVDGHGQATAQLCIHELFEQRAGQNPDAIAAVFSEESIRYGELNAQSNQIAHFLLEQGIKPDSLVGIFVESSLEMLIGILAVLKAGGAYVPIDPRYPQKRIEHILADAQLDILLTENQLLSDLPAVELQTLPLDRELRQVLFGEYADVNIDRQAIALSPSNLAYVIYTSGSTGQPKGVAIEHSSLVLSTQARFAIYGEEPSSFALLSSYAFDSSIAGIFWTLSGGGKLCLSDLSGGLDIPALEKMMQGQKVSHFLALPSVYSSLLDSGIPSPATMCTVIVAGEECPRELVAQHRAATGWSRCRLVNEYGPTEACVWSTYYDCKDYRQGTVPIGSALPHTRLYVLDEHGQLCPPGVIGELYIGGAGLAREYYNLADETRQKFIASPLPGRSAERLYKTSDLVRWLAGADGKPDTLAFMGRVDNQVKIRGFRIETGEIESHLMNHNAVFRAVVAAKGEPKKLIAYVIPDLSVANTDDIRSTSEHSPGREGESRSRAIAVLLRSYLKGVLPAYMVPVAFMTVDTFPVSANGKIDRDALPLPDMVAQDASQYVAPRSDRERLLCEIWQQVLGLEKVGVNDNFFNIGGDSIISIKLVTLAARHNILFTVKDIFTAKTVAGLATIAETPEALQNAGTAIAVSDAAPATGLSNNRSTAQRININSLQRKAAEVIDTFSLLTETEMEGLERSGAMAWIEDAFPLATLQLGMIYDNQVNQNKGTYHDIISFRIQEKWSEAQFVDALKVVVQKNEMLRSVVRLEGERPLHLIYKSIELPISVVNLCEGHLTDSEKERRLAEWQQRETVKPFDLNKPLWSVVIHLFSANSFQYSLSCHHALLDGWSVATMITELFDRYLSSLNNQPAADLTALPYRYFVAAELSCLASATAEQYWRDNLQDAVLPWWTGKPKGPSTYLEWTLEEKERDQLQCLTSSLGVPERAFFLTVHMLLLKILNGKRGITSSVVFNGRPEKEGGDKTLGLFLNTLPFTLDSPRGTWSDLITAVSCQLMEMMSYRQYAVARIQRDTGLDFSGALFDYTHFHVYSELQKQITVLDTYGFVETNYLYILNCAKNNQTENFHLSLTLDKALFDDEFAHRIKRYCSQLVSEMLTNPDNSVDLFAVQGEEEQQKVLHQFNETDVPRVQTQNIHTLIESRASQYPEAEAVITSDDEKISYAELNREANRVAHYLVEQGVTPDTLVGICIERSLELVIGILGILKAGGAYVPIDPDYPMARIEYLLQDSGVEILLTESHLLASLPLDKQKILPLDSEFRQSLLQNYPVENRNNNTPFIQADHLAYVIYTSGSTGKPKGVMVERESVCNLAQWQARYYGVTPESRVAQFASYNFDGSVGETFMALLNGATLVMLDRELSPQQMLDTINRQRINILVLVPSLLNELDPALIQQRRDLTVVAVGESCPAELAQRWSGHCQFRNGYGPTECTVYSHIWAVPETFSARACARVPIGKPIDNLQSYILDENQTPVPIGVIGELYLAGVGLARGYLNNPELTREKFLYIDFNSNTLTPVLAENKIAWKSLEKGEIREKNFVDLCEAINRRAAFIETTGPYTPAADVLPVAEFLKAVENRLSEELFEKTRAFVEGDNLSKVSYECFQRYVLEGVNNSYASSGIGREVLSELLPFDSYAGLRGVDFGFGNGEILRILQSLGAMVTGVDINPIFVEQALSVGLNARMIRIDDTPRGFLEQSGIERNSQDFVITTLTLDRVEKPVNLLRNLFSVLKPGGRFAVQTLLPIIAIEDGAIKNPIVYTLPESRLTPGVALDEDKKILANVLFNLGASALSIYQIPYVVCSRDGVQQYTVWSFSGQKIHDSIFVRREFTVYRTGDLARYLADGNIEYMGRIDHQVKIRGQRIEPGEIEAALALHDGVKQAVVVAKGNPPRLLAYITRQTDSLTVETLRNQVKSVLTDAMVPEIFVFLDALPLTPNGKIDRNALPAPAELETRERSYVEPDTETQTRLCALWQSLLGLERVGITENFFDLGGHSLLAVRLVSEVRSQFQVDINVRTLFDNNTIGGLAAVIDSLARRQSPSENRISRIEKSPDNLPRPLSFAQQRLWLVDQIQPGSCQYNIPMALRLEGELNTGALTRAFRWIIGRHQVLRTTFSSTDIGEPIQVVSEQFAFELPVIDLQALLAQQQTRAITQYWENETRRPFDLSRDLMIRASLLQCDVNTFILLITLHHIASDGWSQSILVKEFVAFYQASISGRAIELAEPKLLPEPKLQYTDYARWQRDWLTGRVLEEQLNYWKGCLDNIPAVHNIPLDYQRPASQDYEGTCFKQVINRQLLSKIYSVVRKHDATLFMFLHGAFSTLLFRHSGENDIVIGTPVANRDHAELAPLVGFFVNTLVLRADFSDQPAFIDLLLRCKQYLLGAYEHQQLPFEKLVDELQPLRDLSYSPLFQIKLALQNNAQVEFELPGVLLKSAGLMNTTAKYDLSLDIFEEEDGLYLYWGYATSLFRASSIEKMAAHFEKLLEEIVEAPNKSVLEYPLITREESRLLLQAGDGGRGAEDNLATEACCIHELFERAAAENGNTIAIRFVDGEHSEALSYFELNARANQLADFLIQQGISIHSKVCVCLTRSPEMVISLLAILKAGATYLAIEPRLPRYRRELILEDAQVDMLLTQQVCADASTAAACRVIDLTDMNALTAACCRENIPRARTGLTASDRAYIVYTSGSTGRPKGVQTSHQSVVNYLGYLQSTYQLGASDRVLQLASFSFDASVRDLFGPLVCGAEVLLMADSVAGDLEAVSNLLQRQNVTAILSVVPSLLRSIVDTISAPASAFSLRLLLVSGEPLPLTLCREVKEKFGATLTLVNQYGPTECTMTTTYQRVPADLNNGDDRGRAVVSIGRPLQNTQVYILDRGRKLVPVGVPGEVYIGGMGVTRGYLNREQLNAARFIANPFSGDSNTRLYRTGDLARWLGDEAGLPERMEFLGRIDQQVKIRGVRVEPGEVEAVLRTLNEVSDVVVIARDEPARIVAYIVLNQFADSVSHYSSNYPFSHASKLANPDVSAESVSAGDDNKLDQTQLIALFRAGLKERIPDYMIPERFVFVSTIPLTANGKVDRNALPEPDVLAQFEGHYVAPHSETEKQLCDIWKTLLNLEKVGITDDFFELGGNSLIGMKFIAQIKKVFNVSLSMQNLFNDKVIYAIARTIDGTDGDGLSAEIEKRIGNPGRGDIVEEFEL